MAFSNDGVNWSAWQPFAGSATWTVAAVSGQVATIWAEYADVAGNVSAPCTTTVLVDLYPDRPHSANFRMASDVMDAAGVGDPGGPVAGDGALDMSGWWGRRWASPR